MAAMGRQVVRQEAVTVSSQRLVGRRPQQQLGCIEESSWVSEPLRRRSAHLKILQVIWREVERKRCPVQVVRTETSKHGL